MPLDAEGKTQGAQSLCEYWPCAAWEALIESLEPPQGPPEVLTVLKVKEERKNKIAPDYYQIRAQLQSGAPREQRRAYGSKLAQDATRAPSPPKTNQRK